jgi:hypothetical protein
VLRDNLPEHHLSPETKDLVKVGFGLVGTMTALLLGLLVASGKSSYEVHRAEVTEIAADTILLDRTLAHYGPEATELRAMLKVIAGNMLRLMWSQEPVSRRPLVATNAEALYDKIQDLTPRTEKQHKLQLQAEEIALRVGRTRYVLIEQGESSMTRAFLVVVIFWLTLLFASFALFAPRNGTATATLVLSAMAVSGAIFLILGLDHPFQGVIQIPKTAMIQAYENLGK